MNVGGHLIMAWFTSFLIFFLFFSLISNEQLTWPFLSLNKIWRFLRVFFALLPTSLPIFLEFSRDSAEIFPVSPIGMAAATLPSGTPMNLKIC